MSVDLDQLISTLEWAAANSLSEMVLTIDGSRITILRDSPERGPHPSSGAGKPAAVQAELQPHDDIEAVTAPLAGLCHLRPEEEAAAFVGVGDMVSEGQTLCVIEAMKVMTTIPAPRAGVVEAVLVSDGQSVDAGMPVLRLT
jgi:acetyl-CoA carboxylase biotin carboxyl carrier protein